MLLVTKLVNRLVRYDSLEFAKPLAPVIVFEVRQNGAYVAQ
jgi:hypothetical protein